MPRKGRKAAKLWSLHPQLHNDVARLLDDEGLQLSLTADNNPSCHPGPEYIKRYGQGSILSQRVLASPTI
jgi:hypothetical protein